MTDLFIFKIQIKFLFKMFFGSKLFNLRVAILNLNNFKLNTQFHLKYSITYEH